MENYPLFELKAKLTEIEKRLYEEDEIGFRGFEEEIEEDKEKVKQLKRSIAILESNDYSKEKCEHKMILGNVDDFYCAECNKQM